MLLIMLIVMTILMMINLTDLFLCIYDNVLCVHVYVGALHRHVWPAMASQYCTAVTMLVAIIEIGEVPVPQ